MSNKTSNQIYIKKIEGIVYIEFFIVSIYLAIVTVKRFGLDTAMGILVFVAYFFVLKVLFSASSIFRWVIIITMSAAWAYFALGISMRVTGTERSAWIISSVVFVYVAWKHYTD